MIPPEIIIREADSGDAQLLAEIGAKTFLQTFGDDNTPENMAAYLSSAFSPEIQAGELAQPGSVFLIAESEGKPVGYARIQAGSTESGVSGARPVELVRIYMLREWIGRGGGARLMQACIEAARSGGGDVLWLGVWEKNPRAIAFYQRSGFTIAGKHTFQLGDESQTDYIMQRELG